MHAQERKRNTITHKMNFCHNVLTLMSFQPCMAFFLLQKTKNIILNVLVTIDKITVRHLSIYIYIDFFF